MGRKQGREKAKERGEEGNVESKGAVKNVIRLLGTESSGSEINGEPVVSIIELDNLHSDRSDDSMSLLML